MHGLEHFAKYSLEKIHPIPVPFFAIELQHDNTCPEPHDGVLLSMWGAIFGRAVAVLTMAMARRPRRVLVCILAGGGFL